MYTGFNWLRGGSNKFVDVIGLRPAAPAFRSSRRGPSSPSRMTKLGWARRHQPILHHARHAAVDRTRARICRHTARRSSLAPPSGRIASTPTRRWKEGGHSAARARDATAARGGWRARDARLHPRARRIVDRKAFILYVGPREYSAARSAWATTKRRSWISACSASSARRC